MPENDFGMMLIIIAASIMRYAYGILEID